MVSDPLEQKLARAAQRANTGTQYELFIYYSINLTLLFLLELVKTRLYQAS